MEEKTYLAIDLKSFYASVECVERGLNPLTTNLVVADASRTEKTICLAVTPSLKAYGLSGRSRLFEVEQKLRDIKRKTNVTVEYITAIPRMALYMEYSVRIYGVYLKYFSYEDIHVYSIDEVFIDATNYMNLYGLDSVELATKVIKDILRETGITATAGIAPNLYLCKIAMDIVAKHVKADEDGVRIAVLDMKSFRQSLWEHRPLTDFWRTGPGIARKLEQNGMYTMGDIALMSLHNEDFLYKLFGVDAEIMIDHAWGYESVGLSDIKGYHSKVNSISSGQVLTCPYDYKKTAIIIREMTELLILDLVDKQLVTNAITLDIGYDRISVDEGTYFGDVVVDHYGRAVPKPTHGTVSFGSHTSSTARIVDEIMKLFERIFDKRLFARRIGITAQNVIEEAYEQYDLFTDPFQLERERKMQKAMLSIQKKFGKNAILKGTNLEEGATTIERNKQIGGHKA